MYMYKSKYHRSLHCVQSQITTRTANKFKNFITYFQLLTGMLQTTLHEGSAEKISVANKLASPYFDKIYVSFPILASGEPE